MFRFPFAKTIFCALPSGALYWPDQKLLCVSDLHFGKAERLARRGGSLLPPYETRATLERLTADITALEPERVICLGDSFDDLAACDHLVPRDMASLTALMSGRDWVWIEGNHDAGPTIAPGSHLDEMPLAGVVFCHIATARSAEISGHYHPKLRLAGQARRCFLIDSARIVLPAYGTYTGGLWTHDPALTALMARNALAVTTGAAALPMPMPRVGFAR